MSWPKKRALRELGADVSLFCLCQPRALRALTFCSNLRLDRCPVGQCRDWPQLGPPKDYMEQSLQRCWFAVKWNGHLLRVFGLHTTKSWTAALIIGGCIQSTLLHDTHTLNQENRSMWGRDMHIRANGGVMAEWVIKGLISGFWQNKKVKKTKFYTQ